MRKLYIISACFLLMSVVCIAKENKYTIKKIKEGLYLMYYDSTAEKHLITKSTIIEFKNYIALLEMPISNDGAGATNLKDHSQSGEEVLAELKNYFPGKPLKYLLSSHWHPHSISSIIPFISKGITVVTTKNNFKRLSEFVDSANFNKYRSYIKFVEEDSLVLKDKTNSIVAYKFNKTDYPNVPTEDFLYFYLPKYHYFHCSCMFQRLFGAKVKGKEIISPRVEDLDRFLVTKNIKPKYLIGTDSYWDDASEMISGDSLQLVMQKGIAYSSLVKDILNIDETILTTQTDSVIKYMMSNTIPYSVLNRAVYDLFKKKELKKALSIARIQALMTPADPNVWDTFGEAYYFLGEMKLAKKYEGQSKKIDKYFILGGEETWKKELENFEKEWKEK